MKKLILQLLFYYLWKNKKMLRLSDTLISKIILIIFSLSYIICGIFVLNETTNNYNIWAYVFISLINYLANILLTLFINHIHIKYILTFFIGTNINLTIFGIFSLCNLDDNFNLNIFSILSFVIFLVITISLVLLLLSINYNIFKDEDQEQIGFQQNNGATEYNLHENYDDTVTFDQLNSKLHNPQRQDELNI